jgi:dihydrodipicolinate synthase/N-acetylneuraminate lyase
MTEKLQLHRKEYLQPSELTGIFVPTVTPFKSVNGDITLDLESHIKHIKNLARPSSGVSGIFLGSSAGQGKDMSLAELKLSIRIGILAARSVNKDLPVIVGALRKNISEVLEIVEYAKKSGADAIVITPGYTDQNIYQTLEDVSSHTDLPIILYNNPKLQNKENLPLEFIMEARNNSQVIGIKDTSGESGNKEYFEDLLRLFRTDKRHVMQGNTRAGLDESIRRADGMVPVQANLYPEILAKIVDRNQPFDNTELLGILNSIDHIKTKYGGTIGFIINVLAEKGIFNTKLTYPKAE